MRMVVLTKKALIISIVVIACILLAVILVTSMGEGNSSPALDGQETVPKAGVKAMAAR